MQVSRLTHSGNSSKFRVDTKRGEFTIAISYTLRTLVWKLDDEHTEAKVAQELAEAIVSRHDPTIPFKPIYIFAEHNSEASYETEIQRIRKHGKDT